MDNNWSTEEDLHIMKALAVGLSLTFLTGCTSLNGDKLLPSTETKVKGFSSYEDAYGAYQSIYEGQTRVTELASIGFDPETSPNVTVLRYTDVVSIFLSNPSLTKNDIPKGILDCLEAQNGCVAYRFKMENIHKERYGNFVVDALNFRKRTHTSGWTFEILIVVVDDIVVYALHSGSKHIDRSEIKRNPLGPLQDLNGSDVKSAVF
jgi:hypothetical protein